MSPMEIIFASASIAMSVFLLYFGRYLVKRDKKEDGIQKSLMLVLMGVRKIGQLSYATAIAVQGKKINGEMDTAMDGYVEYMNELDEHLANQAFKK